MTTETVSDERLAERIAELEAREKRLREALNSVWSDAVHMPTEQAVREIRKTVDAALAQREGTP